MTLELYPGYLSLGGNEVINNERTRGILESLDCPVSWFQYNDDQCPSLQNFIVPPELSPWTTTAVNLATNPSMETPTGAAAEIRRNYIKDPLGLAVATEWYTLGGTSVGVTGGVEFTANSTGAIRFGPEGQIPASTAASTKFEFVADFTGSVDVHYRPSGGGSTSGQVNIATLTFTAGVPVTFSAPFTSTFSGPTSSAAIIIVTTGLVVGAKMTVTQPMLEIAPACGPYFDGSTPSESGFTYAWTGSANLSASTQSAVNVAAMTGGVQTTQWASDRTASLLILGTVTGDDSYSVLAAPAGGWVGGQTYTVVATVYLPATQTGTLHTRARRIAAVFSDATEAVSEAAPNAAGATQLRLTFTAPELPTTTELRLYNGSGKNAGYTLWDGVMIVPVDSTSLPYGGNYFDGATEDEPLIQYVWDGTADASASTAQTRELIVSPPMSTSVADAPWYDLDLPGASGDFFGTYATRIESTTDSTREASVAEGILNGGSIGRMRLATRSVRVQAMLFARNSSGLEYGRSWLDAVTSPNACGQHGTRCGVTDLLFLAQCPPDLADYPPDAEGYNDDVDALVRFMHAVEVTSGPFTVEEYKFKTNGFVAQMVEFTVTSERAYIYGRTREVDLPTSDSVVVQDTPFNLVPYPSAEIAGGDVVVARNLSTNPSVEVNATGWSMVAATVSGTSPAAYFTSGRSTDIAAAGTASMRGRILGNGSTEVAASVATITATQSVTLGSQPAGTRFSTTIWGAGLISAGAAVSSVSSIVASLEWLDGSSAVVGTVALGSTTDPVEIQGRVYSAESLAPPATAVTARAKIVYTVGWRSSATAANNSDVRVYADALAVTVP